MKVRTKTIKFNLLHCFFILTLATIPATVFAQYVEEPYIVIPPATIQPDCRTYTGCGVFVMNGYYRYHYHKRYHKHKRHRYYHRCPVAYTCD